MSIEMRKAGILLAALVASAPIASNASVEAPAIDRCVEIFVKEVVPANRPADIRSADIRAAIKPISPNRSRVMLIAEGERDSQLFGRASCVIDRQGMLVAVYLLESKAGPGGSGRPKVLARNVDPKSDVRTARASETKPF